MFRKQTWATASTTAKGRKIFRKGLIVMLMLLVNYVCAYSLTFIWNQIYCYYVIIIVTSLLAGIVSADFTRSIVYVSVSLLISAAISVGINILPLVTYGEDPLIISGVIFGYARHLALMLISTLPLCVFVALMGCFLGEPLRRE